MQKALKPQLLKAFRNEATKKSVEVWKTSCIVANFGKNQISSESTVVLINPGNPELSGVSKFAYFPRGGPVPSPKAKWETSGNWGGMDAGTGILYPASVVDGLVHQLGGWKLSLQCKIITALKGGCPTGTSVVTTYGDEMLNQRYEQIIHTSPPFYNDEGADNSLRSSYQSAFKLAFDNNRRRTKNVACLPLLGAGARGFPMEVAIEIAASESMRWRDVKDGEHGEKVLMFGLLELNTSEELILAMEART